MGGVFVCLFGLNIMKRDFDFKLLWSSGVKVPGIPVNHLQVVMKNIKGLEKGIGQVVKSSGIDIGY